MDSQIKYQYTVEYELSGVIFFENVMAFDMYRAKEQIQTKQINAKIHAVSLVEEVENKM